MQRKRAPPGDWHPPAGAIRGSPTYHSASSGAPLPCRHWKRGGKAQPPPMEGEQGGGIHLSLLHPSSRDPQEEPGDPPEATATSLPGGGTGAATTPAPATAPARPSAGCKGRAGKQRVEAPGKVCWLTSKRSTVAPGRCWHHHSPPGTLDFVPWAHPAVRTPCPSNRGPVSSLL